MKDLLLLNIIEGNIKNVDSILKNKEQEILPLHIRKAKEIRLNSEVAKDIYRQCLKHLRKQDNYKQYLE